MTQRDRDLEEMLRRALRAATDSVEPADDGLQRIRARLTTPRPLLVAWMMTGYSAGASRVRSGLVAMSMRLQGVRGAVSQHLRVAGPGRLRDRWHPAWLRPGAVLAIAVFLIAAGVLALTPVPQLAISQTAGLIRSLVSDGDQTRNGGSGGAGGSGASGHGAGQPHATAAGCTAPPTTRTHHATAAADCRSSAASADRAVCQSPAAGPTASTSPAPVTSPTANTSPAPVTSSTGNTSPAPVTSPTGNTSPARVTSPTASSSPTSCASTDGRPASPATSPSPSTSPDPNPSSPSPSSPSPSPSPSTPSPDPSPSSPSPSPSPDPSPSSPSPSSPSPSPSPSSPSPSPSSPSPSPSSSSSSSSSSSRSPSVTGSQSPAASLSRWSHHVAGQAPGMGIRLCGRHSRSHRSPSVSYKCPGRRGRHLAVMTTPGEPPIPCLFRPSRGKLMRCERVHWPARKGLGARFGSRFRRNRLESPELNGRHVSGPGKHAWTVGGHAWKARP